MGEWSQIILGNACSKIGSGATPRGGKEAYLGGVTALIRSQNIYNDRFTREGLVYIDDSQANELRNVVVEEGDVLLNITGDSVARCCQVDSKFLPARVNQHVAIVRPRIDTLDARFLRYSLINPPMQSRLLSLASAGATRNALTKAMIESLTIVAPSLEEQRAIAHILGTLDDKIELNRKMNETLETMARTLFKSWFVDFDPVRAKIEGRDTGLPPEIADLFPDSFEDSELGEVPKGWGVHPLPNLIEVNPTRSLRKNVIAPYLDMANMPVRGHSPSEIIDRAFGSGMKFLNGDTLVARITPCLENGKTAYVDFLKDGQVGWGSTEYIVLRPKFPIPEEYAYCLARSDVFREFAIQSMTGSSGRQRVPAESLSHYLLTAPPQPIAKSFGVLVRPLFERARDAANESRTLAALRDALLPKLLSGEVRVVTERGNAS